MKPSVLIASLVFGAAFWTCFYAILVWFLGLTPAQAIAVIVIVACLAILACFRMMDRASGR